MSDLQDIIKKIIPGFQDIFGNILEQIILYGSVARGTQTEESDVDIALIVRKYTEEMHDRMINFTVDLELEYNKVLSVLLIDYDNFKEWEHVLPFYQNMKKDGIMLWSAA
ncbi:MAG: nucleotidyltransferase domain-containing protein [Blautia sp.]|nr:nucleotidyltransferase domain-containing protein [Lachnoclostridium sp.]MCM1212220.1 nucleotidyltransferase domain-containing protein [Blautia sp.]